MRLVARKRRLRLEVRRGRGKDGGTRIQAPHPHPSPLQPCSRKSCREPKQRTPARDGGCHKGVTSPTQNALVGLRRYFHAGSESTRRTDWNDRVTAQGRQRSCQRSLRIGDGVRLSAKDLRSVAFPIPTLPLKGRELPVMRLPWVAATRMDRTAPPNAGFFGLESCLE